MHNLRGGVNDDLIVSRFWVKVHEVSSRYRGPLVVSDVLSDCLYHVSSRRYFTIEDVENRPNIFRFLTLIFGRDGPNFLRQIAIAIYFLSFGKLWLISV